MFNRAVFQILLSLGVIWSISFVSLTQEIPQPETGYASINGLEMYYEIHGEGKPLLLLHGGLTSMNDFGLVLPSLAESRQVILFDRQAHGRTADIDQPLSIEQMATDTVALLDYFELEEVDILGYSTGGIVALAIAIEYPEYVDKLVVISSVYDNEGYYPEILAGLQQMTGEDIPDIVRNAYVAVAPNPENWSILVDKTTQAVNIFNGWQSEEIQSIDIPTLIIVGDRDIVQHEHTLALYRLLPQAQLAILPDTDHYSILFQEVDRLALTLTTFLGSDAAVSD